jgi:diacylglycerol kinase (ATP)
MLATQTSAGSHQTAARLIYNPAAGRGRSHGLLPEIQRVLKAAGIEADVAQTRAPGDARVMARQAAQAQMPLVIAVGGDGTFQEVANGFVDCASAGPLPALGLVPAGTGNDFPKTLGVADWRAACDLIARGQRRQIDVGRVNGRIFVNNIGIGFDAQVGIEAQKIKRLRGQAVYLAALARTLILSYRTPEVTVQADDETFSQSITMLNVGNGRCSGGGFWFTPQARLDDGLLDLCVIRGLSKPQILGLVPHVMKGAHTTKEPVQMKRARRIVITSTDPLPVHADGEILYTNTHRLEIDLLPGQLTILG